MNRPVHIISTQKLALSGANQVFTVGANPSSYLRLWSDRTFHFSKAGAATVNDTPITAEHEIIIPCPAQGETVNFIKATGETDGSVWVSYISLG